MVNLSNIYGLFECNIMSARLYTIIMLSWSIYISDKKNMIVKLYLAELIVRVNQQWH